MENTGFVNNNLNNFAVVYRIVDLLVIHGALLIALIIYGVESNKYYLMLSLVANVTFAFTAESNRLYRSWRSGFFMQLLFYTLFSWAVAIAFVLVFIFFTGTSETFSRLALGIWMCITGISLVIWRIIFGAFLTKLRARGHNIRRVAIIGMTEQGVKLANEINLNYQTGYRTVAFFDQRCRRRITASDSSLYRGNIQDGVFAAKNGDFDTIFIALPMSDEKRIQDILFQLGDTTADVQVLPNFLLFSMMQASMSHVGNIQTVSVFNNPMSGGSAALKRFEDIVLSLVILSALALPMLAIAVAIKLTSNGPVIFKQDRYGLNGKRIKMWKFRSMTVTENAETIHQAKKNDTRITPIGAFLRRTSLDELPQFINVLQGKMSIVGPRPHAVAHNEQYRKLVGYYMLRHKVKPGITGWAQVNGWRGETETVDKMQKRVDFDLAYIRHWSLWMDVKILVLTLFKGFMNKNAY
ncbi:MAG: undecaprenyl-phosphate glucose phosphotransferase [Pseudomonadota bacterium]